MFLDTLSTEIKKSLSFNDRNSFNDIGLRKSFLENNEEML